MAETGVRIGGSDFLNAEPPSGFGIKMYYHEESGRTRGEIVFDAAKQGPPGCAHGGAVATVLDEAQGAVAWFNGHSALAVNINVNLRHGVPLETPLSATGWLQKVDGSKVHAAAELYLPDGRVAASSTGLFISVEFSGMTQENNPFRPLKEQG